MVVVGLVVVGCGGGGVWGWGVVGRCGLWVGVGGRVN